MESISVGLTEDITHKCYEKGFQKILKEITGKQSYGNVTLSNKVLLVRYARRYRT